MTIQRQEDITLTDLRFAFVEMLFALTVAQVATQVALLVDRVGLRESAAIAPYAQLVLATLLVATSWVGWTRSVAPGNQLSIERVFSLTFLILLLDVVLVIFYFILVKGTEVPTSNAQAIMPSAGNETLCILLIFCGYFLWDFLTKAVASDPTDHPETLKGQLRGIGRRLRSKDYWDRSYSTLLCLILAFTVWLFLRDASTQRDVVLVDGSLLAVVLLFRALKQRAWLWVAVCGAAFLVCGYLAYN